MNPADFNEKGELTSLCSDFNPSNQYSGILLKRDKETEKKTESIGNWGGFGDFWIYDECGREIPP